jgi:hypothetical protein
VPENSIQGASILDGYAVRSVNGQTDHVVVPTNLWALDGNVGTSAGANFPGTTDNQSGELSVGDTLGGGSHNTISRASSYGTIGGGHANTIQTNAVSATIP